MSPPFGLHLAGDQLGGDPGVEPGRPLVRDPLQRRGQVRLAEAVAGGIRLAVLRVGGQRRRVARHARQDARQRRRPVVRQDEPVARQRDGRLDQPPPRQPAVVHPGPVQPGHRARNPDRGVAVVVAREVVGAVRQEHPGRRRGGRRFAEVVGVRFAAGRAVHEKAAAADVARVRVGHGQHERGGDRRIHGAAARAQRLHAGLGGEPVGRHHHAVLRPRRRRLGAGRCAGGQEGARGDCYGPWSGWHWSVRSGTSG